MSEDPGNQATRILGEMRGGDSSAAERLLPLVYSELRALAGQLFKGQPADHTLQPTALVHEAYAKLIKQEGVEWQDRAHFMAVASKAMRNLLVDHARKRKAGKRGQGWNQVALDSVIDSAARRSIDLIDLEEALDELSRLHPRMAQVIELRFFGALSIREAAEVLGINRSTADLDMATGRAWLTRRLAEA